MAYINVNHKKLETTAAVIDNYITKHKKNMKNIDREMDTLAAAWKGMDYEAVKKEWEEMQASGSTSAKMIKTLSSYADYLRMAKAKYVEAQSKAVNRAERLPKW